MYILGSILVTLAQILSMAAYFYQFVIIGVIVVSWVGADPYNPIVRFLRQLTEPVFHQIRRRLPRSWFRTGLDFTPMIVLLALFLLEGVVFQSIRHYGQRLMLP